MSSPKTILVALEGKWQAIYGHGCETEEELHQYVAALGHAVAMKVGTEDEIGTEADVPISPMEQQRRDAIAGLSKESKRQILDALKDF